jgi:hypothetical protein
VRRAAWIRRIEAWVVAGLWVQVQLGPGQVTVTRRAIQVGGVPTVADLECCDQGQYEYCDHHDSVHGSNLATNQIQPQLALLTVFIKFLPY